MRFSSMIHAVDVHACGEPGRVIVGGVPPVPGDTMFAKAQYLEQHLDHIRKRMLNEPRGNPPLCCNIVLPPCHPEADIGFVIMEHVEYPGMSGSNTICTATAVLETGILPMVEPVTEFTMEAPAGLIRVRAECSNGKVNSVTFTNVPAFAVALDRPIEVPTLGTVLVDVAYGGMFYAITDATQFGLRLTPDEGADITRITEIVKVAAAEQIPVTHPEIPAFTGITIAQLSGPAHDPTNSMRNAVTLSTGVLDWDRPSTWTGVLDRSPCGTGTSARMAQLAAKGRLKAGDTFVHESIIGSLFDGRVEAPARVGNHDAIVPSIAGWARQHGINTIFVDDRDPFSHGFQVQ